MEYYFAYGSNMSRKQMKSRCKDCEFLAKAYIKNYRFVFDGYSEARKGAVGNIVHKDKGIVWGGLYEISGEDEIKLDKCEGYNNGIYDKKEIDVITDDGLTVTAIVYFRVNQDIGIPSEEYIETVIEGARDCYLPDDYIDYIVSLA